MFTSLDLGANTWRWMLGIQVLPAIIYTLMVLTVPMSPRWLMMKGRYEEGKRNDDHLLKGQTYKILQVLNGQLVEREVPMLNALNEVLRDDYIKDSVGGVERWNKVIEKAGIPFRLKTPHKAFHRNIGGLSGAKVSPDGRVVSDAEWKANVDTWLPSGADRAFVASLMGRVVEPGKFANWIAPPVMGINRQPVDFEYVRFG